MLVTIPAVNLAAFEIEGSVGGSSPSTDLGFDAEPLEVLDFRLEGANASLVTSWQLRVYDASDSTSPRASGGAPELTLVGATSGQTVSATAPSADISSTMPNERGHSWLVRSIVNGGNGPDGKPSADYVFERILAIRTDRGGRKVIATEGTQYSLEGWAESLNQQIDGVPTFAIADLSITTAKLASLAVTEAKLASGAVTEAKIGSLAVTEAKLGALAVTTAKIADGAVTLAKMAAAAANTLLGVAGGSTATPAAIAVAANTLLGRAAGNIEALALATHSILGRGAGNVSNLTATEGQILGRPTGGALGFGALSAFGLESGSWSPTFSSNTNLDAPTSAYGNYLRIGDVVFFSLRFAAVTSGATATRSVEMTLPVARTGNFAGTDATGAATAYSSVSTTIAGRVQSVTGAQRLICETVYSTASHGLSFAITGSYRLT